MKPIKQLFLAVMCLFIQRAMSQNCTGAPVAGTVVGPSSICGSTNFTLSLSGTTSGGGLLYQWQYAPAGTGNWLNAASNSATLTTSLSASTDFRCLVICSFSGMSSYSNEFTVNVNLPRLCYCRPPSTTLHTYNLPSIDSVAIINTSLNSKSVGSASNGYSQIPVSATTTASLQQGVAYSLAVKVSYQAIVGVWFDWNQNNNYEASEFTLITSKGAGTVSGSFTVPAGALPGITGMRIRSHYGVMPFVISGGDACSSFPAGETEEYFVTVVASVPCTGTPVTGIAKAPSTACSSIPFTISLTGNTQASGIVYQWQSSPQGSNTFSNIGGANAPVLSNTQAAPTDYRCLVTCSGSGLFAFSNVVSVGNIPCYCSPLLGNSLHNPILPSIDSVAIAGTTLQNAGLGENLSGYSQFDASGSSTGTLQQGLSYQLSVKVSASSSILAWFDWNHNGSFETSEFFQIATNSDMVATASIPVPASALTGFTAIRIRTRNAGYTATGNEACTIFTSGETEDYAVTVTAPIVCSGTPVAGSVVAPLSVCANASFSLSLTGQVQLAGFNYQWQRSAPGANSWANITGNSNVISTSQNVSSDYRCIVTCSASGLSAFSPVITVNNGVCYCSPLTGTVLHSLASSAYCINSVKIDGTTLSTNNTGLNNANGYTPPGTAPNATAALMQGNNYTLTVGLPTGGQSVSAWFDWNNNQVFEASEWVMLTANSGSTGLAVTNFSVPLTALPGLTGMRIRSRVQSFPNGAGDACSIFGGGETEDCFVTIVLSATLPVTLGDFRGNKNGQDNLLSWSTLSESNNKGFYVEGGTDVSNLTRLSFVPSLAADGNSSGLINYQFTEKGPFATSRYYRLVQIDKDGKETLSQIVAIQQNGTTSSLPNSFTVYPNPVTNGQARIVINSALHEVVTISLLDMTGRVLLVRKEKINAGTNTLPIDIDKAAKGTYLLKAVYGTNSQVVKLVIQ